MRTRYLLLTAIWGASFLLIKVGLEALAPLQIVLGRLVFGALALIVVVAVGRATARPAMPARPRRAPTAVRTAPSSLVPSWPSWPRGPS